MCLCQLCPIGQRSYCDGKMLLISGFVQKRVVVFSTEVNMDVPLSIMVKSLRFSTTHAGVWGSGGEVSRFLTDQVDTSGNASDPRLNG
jgi:hypothetical protein